MMKNRVLNVAQTKAAEKASGESEDTLIERAAAKLHEYFCTLSRAPQSVTVLVGGGNNGADGLSFAKLAVKGGYKVSVYLVTKSRNEYAEKRVKELDAVQVQSANDIDYSPDYIVDAMLGTGGTRAIEGLLLDIVNRVNNSKAKVIAVDVPSGLNADSGYAMGEAVYADETVTFGSLKQGHLIGQGRNYCGRVTVCDIGLPMGEFSARVVSSDDIQLPARKAVTHKGNYGNVKIIGGSNQMAGGVKLSHESAIAALRGGTGYATLCVPQSMMLAYAQNAREEMLELLPDDGGKIIYNQEIFSGIAKSADCVLIGMGMGDNAALSGIIKTLAAECKTLIVDADGLNAASKSMDCLKGHKCKLILTPHVGEFRRLTGTQNFDDEIAAVRTLASRLDCVIAMKSATTIISDGNEVWLNTTGSPAMAKAGSGDVLAGYICGIAASASPLKAVMRACYLFGKAGEKAVRSCGENAVVASDLIEYM